MKTCWQRFIWRVKHPLKKIIKIFKYIPVLWKDEDWDYYYIIALLKFKLERVRHHLKHERYFQVVGQEKTLRRLDILIEACDRFLNKDYAEELGIYKLVEKYYDERVWEGNRPMFKEYLKEDKALLALLKDREHKLVQQDLDIIGKYMSKYLRQFWD